MRDEWGHAVMRVAILLLAVLAPIALEAQSLDEHRLWTLLQTATADRERIAPALEEIRATRPSESRSLSVVDAALLDAYEGALLAMSATTTAWPPSKLSRAREGLSLLDGAVAAAPSDPEVRYLRLVICHHLPSLFRRGATAREDADALAGMLVQPPSAPISDREPEMAAFLLATGYLPDTLEAAIRSRFPGS